MAFKLLLLSPEIEDFERLLEIPESATLFDLHQLILQAVDYPSNLFTSFMLCDEDYNVLQEITNDSTTEEEPSSMQTTSLSEVINQEDRQLVYIFDTLTERCFFVKYVGTSPSCDEEAKVVKSKGNAPSPILSDAEMDALLFENPLDESSFEDFSCDEDEEDFGEDASFDDSDFYSDNPDY